MSAKNQDSHPVGQKQLKDEPGPSPANVYQTLWQTNEPIDVDAYEPINVKQESLPIITKVESVSDQEIKYTLTKEEAIGDVCRLLGLNSNQPLHKVKEDLRNKPVQSHDSKCNFDKPATCATTCKTMFIVQMPLWFHFFHVEALIELYSDFDVDCGSYYIDMITDPGNVRTDKCLIRFTNNSDCLQVFKALQGIVLDDVPLMVCLDPDNAVSNERDKDNPNFNEQLRIFNEKRAHLLQNSNGSLDNGATNIVVKIETDQEKSDDDIEFIEPETTDLTGDDPPESEQTENEEINCIEINIKKEEKDVVDLLNEADEEAVDVSHDADYKECRIVHIKNLDPSRAYAIHGTIRDLIKAKIGKEQTFQYRKVWDENKRVCSDVLLMFSTHPEAENACKILDGAVTSLTGDGSRLKAVMGVGYKMRDRVTTTDLRLFALKRKIKTENQNAAKKPKTETSSLPPTNAEKSPSRRREDSPKARERSPASDRTERSPMPSYDDVCRTGFITVDERNFTAYGLSKEFMQKYGLKMPFSRAVLVTRIRGNVTKEKLFEVFSLAGEVKNINYTPSDLSDKNSATIEFDHPLEAIQAISMLDGQKLYNQSLNVVMAPLARKKKLPKGLLNVGQGLGKNGAPLRGLRFEAELRRLHEAFTDLGKMERQVADKDSPFKFNFKFISPKNIAKTTNQNRETSSNSDSSRGKGPSTNTRSKSAKNCSSYNSGSSKSTENSKESSKDKSEDSAIPQGTLLAIQALGTVLVAQGLIPPQTNCKSLQSILGALQKNSVTKQIDLNRTTATKKASAITNLEKLNLIPNKNDALNQAIHDVMQFMPLNSVTPKPVPPPSIPVNVQSIPPLIGNSAPNPNKTIGRAQNSVPPAIIPNAQNVPVVPLNNPVTGNELNRPQTRFDVTPKNVNPGNRPLLPLPTLVTPFSIRAPPQPPPAPVQPNINPIFNKTRRTLREVPTTPIQSKPVQSPAVRSQTAQNQPASTKPQQNNQTSGSGPRNPDNLVDCSKDKEPTKRTESLRKSEMLAFKNLPPCVTTDILASKMREVGEVKFCEMTGRGCAFVRFKNAHDADRCIRLFHNSKVDGQVIEVGFL